MQAGLAGWGALALVAFSTLSPIGLRPHLAGQHVEHVAAFAALATLLGIAHPRRLPLVFLAVVLAAVGLEAMQLLLPDRHGRLVDLLVKVGGAGLGTATAAAVNLCLDRLKLRFATRG